MKERRDYLVNMESANWADQVEVYHGTLKEAKRAARSIYRKDMKEGDRLIIRVGDKIVAEYYEKEGWIDFITEEIVNKKS